MPKFESARQMFWMRSLPNSSISAASRSGENECIFADRELLASDTIREADDVVIDLVVRANTIFVGLVVYGASRD